KQSPRVRAHERPLFQLIRGDVLWCKDGIEAPPPVLRMSMKDRHERMSRQFQRRAWRDAIEDVLHIVRGAFVIQDIEAGACQSQPPCQHLRRESDRLLV